jgi:hypothetical protein
LQGFTAEYAVQAPGGILSAYGDLITANTLLTNTPGCWTIKARYKLAAACGELRRMQQAQILPARKQLSMLLYFLGHRYLQHPLLSATLHSHYQTLQQFPDLPSV